MTRRQLESRALWFLPLLLVCLLISGALVAFAPPTSDVEPPKPKRATGLKIVEATCPATGNCRVILTWTRPSNYLAAFDTARTDWDQTAPAAFPNLRAGKPLGTADTFSIVRPAQGQSKSGVVQLCYDRATVGSSCNAPVAWTVKADLPPVDTATNVKVVRLETIPAPRPTLTQTGTAVVANYLLTPADTADQCSGETTINDATGRIATGCPSAPSVQFCSAFVLADSTVVWHVDSQAIAACESQVAPLFAAIYGARWHPERTRGTPGDLRYTLTRL